MHSPLSGLRPCCARALKAAIAALFIFLAAHGAAAQEINPWKPSGTVYWIASPMRLNLGFTDENGTPRAAHCRKVGTTCATGTTIPTWSGASGREVTSG